MIIGFIHGQGLRISQPLIVADTIDYLEADFKFLTSDWSGLTKYAHFKLGDLVYDIQLIEDKIDKDKHLNLAAGEWEIYLHGNEFAGGEVIERITTEIAKVTVKHTGVLEGEPFPSSIPSMTEQILSKIGDMENLETEAKNTLVDAINEANSHGSGGAQTNAYAELSKLKKYLYSIYYNELDYDNAYKAFEAGLDNSVPAGCTSVRKGNLYGRNFDWLYNEQAEFIISTPRINNRYASVGIATSGLLLSDDIVDSKKYSDEYKLLPFKMCDGINEHGVAVNINVVPIDYEVTTGTTPTGTQEIRLCTQMLPRFVLDNFKTATEAVEYIQQHVSLYTSKTLIDFGYEIHFMVADKDNTYLLETIENELVATNISSKPYMTNYHLTNVEFNDDGTVYTPATQDEEHNAKITNHISDNGSGLERYNLIAQSYFNITDKNSMRLLMNNLRYTNSYKPDTTPYWFTEFVGINNLTVTSDISDFAETVASAQSRYNDRSRDPQSENYGTWHTMHSSIYDLDTKTLYVEVQEENGEYIRTIDIPYEPPIATADKVGVVKVDNETITIDSDGTIHALSTSKKPTYVYNFQVQNWEVIDGQYILSIPVSQHNLGMKAYIISVEKNENYLFLNTMFYYDRESNGTLKIYSDLAYNGRAILQEE